MLVDTPFNSITEQIIGGAIDVHRVVGPGALESIYTACIHHELSLRGLRWRSQQQIPLVYKGVTLDPCYRMDLIVEECVVVELKSVEALLPVHDAQVLSYLKLTKSPVGLLINFNVAKLVHGIRRFLNTEGGPIRRDQGIGEIGV